jgi:hypothetical protein
LFLTAWLKFSCGGFFLTLLNTAKVSGCIFSLPAKRKAQQFSLISCDKATALSPCRCSVAIVSRPLPGCKNRRKKTSAGRLLNWLSMKILPARTIRADLSWQSGLVKIKIVSAIVLISDKFCAYLILNLLLFSALCQDIILYFLSCLKSHNNAFLIFPLKI